MFTLAHISDIHLGPLPRTRFYQLMNKRMLGYLNWQRRRFQHKRELLDQLMADMFNQQPDQVALTGDLVNIALKEEFRYARMWLDSFERSSDITVIPGNHDAYVRSFRHEGFWHWAPYMQTNESAAAFAPESPERFPFVRIFGEIALIGLSSSIPTMPGMASGRLGRSQIARLAELLDQLGRKELCRVVLVHHPPVPRPSRMGWMRDLHDAPVLRRCLSEHGAELVLHGHDHRPMKNFIDGKNGPIPVLGVASASLVSEIPDRYATYNLYGISRQAPGGKWLISMRSRMFGKDGQIREFDHELFS